MTQARLRLLAERLHALCPRPTYELLKELIAGAPLAERLEVYAAVDREVLCALGGDRMPPNAWGV
jgi:hypothetical protein